MPTFRLLTGELICVTYSHELSKVLNVPARRLSIYEDGETDIHSILILPLQGICIQDENTIRVTIEDNIDTADIVHDVNEFLEQNRDELLSITHLIVDVNKPVMEPEYLDKLGELLSTACPHCESLQMKSNYEPVYKVSIRSQERKGKVVPPELTFPYHVQQFWRHFQGMVTRMECNLRKSTMHMEHICAFKRLTHLTTAVGSIKTIFDLVTQLRFASLVITNPLFAFCRNAWSVEEGAARIRDRFPEVNVTVISTGLRQMLMIES